MKSFFGNQDDIRWLRGRLRSHLVCALAITTFALMLRLQPRSSRPLEARAGQAHQIDPPNVGTDSAEASQLYLPPDEKLIQLSTDRPRPIAPTGWRRTDQGWENVSTWRPSARPLGEIVMRQESREPGWMKSALEGLRQLPPLAFAMLQIAAISAIVAISRRDGGGEERDDIEQDATFAGPFAGHRQSASR